MRAGFFFFSFPVRLTFSVPRPARAQPPLGCLLSRISVTGPSFTKFTFIELPKTQSVGEDEAEGPKKQSKHHGHQVWSVRWEKESGDAGAYVSRPVGRHTRCPGSSAIGSLTGATVTTQRGARRLSLTLHSGRGILFPELRGEAVKHGLTLRAGHGPVERSL